MYAHLFKNKEGACCQPDDPAVFLKEYWRAISEMVHLMADSSPFPRYVGGYELMFDDAFLQTPFLKYVLQVEHFAGRKCVLLLQGKSVVKFNCEGPGLVEQ